MGYVGRIVDVQDDRFRGRLVRGAKQADQLEANTGDLPPLSGPVVLLVHGGPLV